MGKPQGIAVVTGAASGMGEAVARSMAEQGWPLLLCDLDAARLAGKAGSAETLAGDLAAPDHGERLTAALAGRPIGALIHCAGLSPTMATPHRILEVNLAATMRLVEAAGFHMAERSCAVLFASSAAHMLGATLDAHIAAVTRPEDVAGLLPLCPDPGTAYAVSKRGVKLLAERLSPAFGARGMRIVSISPGVIDTPMGRAEQERQPIMEALVRKSPLARAGDAEEVAAVAAFLCSPAASFITGTDILVDGGGDRHHGRSRALR